MRYQRPTISNTGTTTAELQQSFPPSGIDGHILSEHLFNKIVRMEEKRAKRSQRPLILLVLDADALENAEDRKVALAGLSSILPGTLRHTDVTGWHEADSSVGILMTEIGQTRPTVARQKVAAKIADALERIDYPWADAINVTAQVIGNGAGSSAETIRLGRVLGSGGAQSGHGGRARPSRKRLAYLRESLLVVWDVCVVGLSSLLAFGASPLVESFGDPRLMFQGCLSLLILLSVSFGFGLYKMERLWLSNNKFRLIGFSTLSVLGLSMLWMLFAPKLLIRPELFLGQTLLAWALSLAWKFMVLKHYLKSEVDRVLSIQHHKAV